MSRSYLLVVLVPLVWAGCVAPGMGGWLSDREISGGQTVRLTFDQGGPVPAEDDQLKVTHAVLELDIHAKPEGDYHFEFEEKTGLKPRSVMVEDVSDDVAMTWAVDPHPALLHRISSFRTPVFEGSSHKVDWVAEIDSSVRIYRFTVVQSDGSTHVLYDAVSYPAAVKSIYRHQLGLDAPPATNP